MGNNGHLNTSTGVDQTGTKQVKPSSKVVSEKLANFTEHRRKEIDRACDYWSSSYRQWVSFSFS